MIDKRVSYQGGGRDASQPDFSPPSAGGSSDDERYQAAQAALKAEADRRQAAKALAKEEEDRRIKQSQRVADQIAVQKDPDRPTSFKPTNWEELTKTTPVEDTREAYISELAEGRDKENIVHDLGDAGETAAAIEAAKKPDLRTQKEKDEDWERDQDWDLIKDLSDKGYGFNEIQSAVEKGLTQKAPTTDIRRQNLIDFGLRSIMPETGLERSLLSRAKSFAPDTGTGITSNLKDYFNPGRMATNYALGKMGLSWLNLPLGIASMFGFKNPFANIGTKWSGVPRKETDTPTGEDNIEAPKKIMEASTDKFLPEHLNILHKRYAELQEVIKSGEYMGQKLNNDQLATLTQTSKQMKDFLVSEVGGIRLTS